MTILAPLLYKSAKEYVTRSWPEYDEDKLTANEVTVVIQVNGKLRGI